MSINFDLIRNMSTTAIETLFYDDGIKNSLGTEAYNILHAINPSEKHPVAGSFALWCWMKGMDDENPSWEPNDIDVFCVHADEADYIPRTFAKIALETSASLRLVHRGNVYEVHGYGPKVQFVVRNIYEERPAPYGFLDGFDLSVAQVAIVGVDGNEIQFAHADPEVRKDICDNVSRVFRSMGTVSGDRLEKYRKRGFVMIQGDVREPGKWGTEYYDENSVGKKRRRQSNENSDWVGHH